MNNKFFQEIIVTGASSLIGDHLLRKLVHQGAALQAVSRRSIFDFSTAHIDWHQIDISIPDQLQSLQPASTLIHLAPLWLLPAIIDPVSELGVKRIIAYSSTSLFTKQNSTSFQDQQLVHKLTAAEQEVENLCQKKNINFTIFRPTLIYNVNSKVNNHYTDIQGGLQVIAKFINTVKFFPLIGSAVGRRQPVHAEDLAHACIQVLDCEQTFGQSYNLSGGEVLSYKEMIDRIFGWLNQTPRFIKISHWACEGVIKLARCIPRYRFLSSEMLNRMNLNMDFDYKQAEQDFGYKPREFLKQ